MSRLQHKPGRKSNYVHLLGSAYWQEVCRLVRLRDGHRCRRCGRNYSLEVHHTTYCVAGKSIVGKEMDYLDCLETLCEECHRKAHGR